MAKKNYNLLTGVIALVAVVLIVSVVGFIVSRPKAIVIQGEAEATEYRVSGKIPGRIEEFRADEGQSVRKGDTLVLIDSPEIRSKIAEANAAKAAAVAQKNKAYNGAQQEQIAGAYEMWQKALVGEEVMRKSFERISELHEEKVVSDQKYDEVKAQYDAASATARAAKSQYDMAVKGARQEDKDAAVALVERANAAVELVNSYMDEIVLTAPADGIIAARYPKVGELVGQGSPIMTIQDLDDMWLTFNVREDRLEGMKSGDKLNLTVPALGNKHITATVYYIAVRESYATWRATKEIGEFDTKTFEVRARPDAKVEGMRPGMSVILERKEK
ncbi:MAG: efflux RND transporter periplasmic adaptor subunit [Bacteroides sp.]|nr:efflux RND transporter periplasmic adaptor subunit [Bacteroidales bacterium]MCI6680570.1 efflux RND transporter periplasmic adaptor subunit [Bacteroides sp.]MDD7489797.1 efflux RND transporter periplasmic adaptor subunit [Bacteroides sp.]MDY5891773.1 efflux RND transporter periplasmic adaptor subunit [Candidatus Cryptobacteroides sp.]CCX56299.1 auxiliary transport protein membrane fusion protein (MFP) family protein [Bacteroides sp. CAG:1060]